MNFDEAFVAAVVIHAYRQVRQDRKELRLLEYTEKLHGEPGDFVTLGETVAMFWLGRLLARHGSDDQMHDWYTMLQGPMPNHPERIAHLRRRLS